MANRVQVRDDGIIYNTFSGDQTAYALEKNAKELSKEIEASHAKGQKALIIMDVSQVNLFDNLAKESAAKTLSSLKYDKLAVIGANPIIRQIAVLLVSATGNAKRVNFFDEESDALTWLNE